MPPPTRTTWPCSVVYPSVWCDLLPTRWDAVVAPTYSLTCTGLIGVDPRRAGRGTTFLTLVRRRVRLTTMSRITPRSCLTTLERRRVAGFTVHSGSTTFITVVTPR